MTEIKINIELGVTAELKDFVTNLFSGAIHTAVMPSPKLNTATAEHMTSPRRRSAKALANAGTDSAGIEETEQDHSPEEIPEPTKSLITLPTLRDAIKRLYDGGRHQEELPAIFDKFGVKNVTEVPEDKYQELYDALMTRAEDLGL